MPTISASLASSGCMSLRSDEGGSFPVFCSGVVHGVGEWSRPAIHPHCPSVGLGRFTTFYRAPLGLSRFPCGNRGSPGTPRGLPPPAHGGVPGAAKPAFWPQKPPLEPPDPRPQKRVKKGAFLGVCGAKLSGSGGAPPTNLILLRNQWSPCTLSVAAGDTRARGTYGPSQGAEGDPPRDPPGSPEPSSPVPSPQSVRSGYG